MAKNTEHGFRKGSVDDRTQLNLDPKNGKYVKRNRETGEFMDLKKDREPFKGVAQEPDRRQDKK
jgi:hypothetical protein